MSLEIDARGLEQLQQRIATAPARIERRMQGRTVRAMRTLLGIARATAHRKSGRLVDSLTIAGPFPIGVGSLEMRVETNVPYAIFEVAQGGAHDYPARTLEQGQSVINDLARDLALIVIEETGAGQG